MKTSNGGVGSSLGKRKRSVDTAGKGESGLEWPFVKRLIIHKSLSVLGISSLLGAIQPWAAKLQSSVCSYILLSPYPKVENQNEGDANLLAT